MLEAGYINLYDQALQEGFEIGVSEAARDSLAVMAGRAKYFCQKQSGSAIKNRKKKDTEYMCRKTRIPSQRFLNVMMGQEI